MSVIVGAVSGADGRNRRRRALDAVVAVAGAQDGVISRAQARECGVSDSGIVHRLRKGEWQFLFPPDKRGSRPGVYVVFSGPIGRQARRWGAVLACGSGATLSHRTAGELHGLFEPPSGEAARWAPIDVTVPADRKIVPPPGVRRHYSGRVDQARHPAKMPPCTRLEETVVDLTQSAKTVDAASAVIAQAVQRRLTTHERIIETMTRRPKLKWRRELLESCGVIAKGAQSLLEIRYVRNVERPHGLPAGHRQVRVKVDGRGIVIDVRYRRYRTRVELDGQRGHTGDGVFRDARRDNAAVLDREWTLRFGWDAVNLQSCETAALVWQVLADRGHTTKPKPCGSACAIEQTAA